MTLPKNKTILLALAGVAIATVGVAQYRRGWGDESPRNGVPLWENDPEFKQDVFTFVRIQWDSGGYGDYDGRRGRGGRRWRRGWGWDTDFPDSDLNFSFRLQQLTSLKVNPNPIILRLTDPQLFDYPFIYIIEPGTLFFSDAEVAALRRYLLNGGFLMVDDFWGDSAYLNFYEQIKRVFPEREPKELSLDHEIFNCVFRLKAKPQVPNYRDAERGRATGRTWEYHDGDCETVHYQGIFDAKGRMMVIICHNTDLGDGWEREGDNEWYFHNFAENKSYPMGINIVTYAMTH
jgi:hypothetical protein